MDGLTAAREGIPQSLIWDFDMFRDERLHREDIHLAYADIARDSPPLFYTPRNGGHWVVSGYDLCVEVMRDHERFSATERSIPRAPTQFPLIPLFVDPPEHGPYRAELLRYFGPKVIRHLERRMREWARMLIASTIQQGECDFIEAIGARFPVSIFLEIMGIPLDRFENFRAFVSEYFADWSNPAKRDAMREFAIGELRHYTDLRREEPRDDFLTHLGTMKIRGRQLTPAEIDSINIMMFIAGLDTVAGTLGFMFRHLAERPDLQQQLREDPSTIQGFVEESLRRFTVVLPPRIVAKDCTLSGVDLRAGEMMLVLLPGAAMDEGKVQCPREFQSNRPWQGNVAFGTGVHVCLGSFLARSEMRILVEEWVKAIPSFARKPGSASRSRLGPILALDRLDLTWDPRTCQVPDVEAARQG